MIEIVLVFKFFHILKLWNNVVIIHIYLIRLKPRPFRGGFTTPGSRCNVRSLFVIPDLQIMPPVLIYVFHTKRILIITRNYVIIFMVTL